MTTLDIKIDIKDELIAQAGVESLKMYLEQAAQQFQMDLLAQRIKKIAGTDKEIDADFQEAKKQAWKEYKDRYLPENLQQIVQDKEPKL